MRTTLWQWALAIPWLAPFGVSAADAPLSHDPFLESRHVVMVGGYWQEADAEISERRGSLPGVGLNLETLGVDEDDSTWYFEYRYRFSDRWTFVGAGQRYTSSGEIGLSREIDFAGVVFPAMASLRTRLRIDTYFADLMYRAYRSEKAEVAIGGGLHVFNFDASLYGNASVVNRFVDRSRELVASDSELFAPLPNVRAQAYLSLTPNWAVAANIGWMSANIDEWDGSFRYLHLRAHLRFNAHLGVALGYQLTDVDVSRDTGRRASRYNMEFSGPSLMLTVSW